MLVEIMEFVISEKSTYANKIISDMECISGLSLCDYIYNRIFLHSIISLSSLLSLFRDRKLCHDVSFHGEYCYFIWGKLRWQIMCTDEGFLDCRGNEMKKRAKKLMLTFYSAAPRLSSKLYRHNLFKERLCQCLLRRKHVNVVAAIAARIRRSLNLKFWMITTSYYGYSTN